MAQDDQDGAEEDAQIHAEGDMPCIPDIHLEALFPRNSIASMGLRIAGQARADIVAMVLFRVVACEILDKQRARPDDGHVALEDVPEFGEFVKGGCAEEASVGDEPLVVGKRVAGGVRLAGHGAELDESEYLLVLPWTFLREERIPLHHDGTEERQQEQERRQNNQCRQREEKI